MTIRRLPAPAERNYSLRMAPLDRLLSVIAGRSDYFTLFATVPDADDDHLIVLPHVAKHISPAAKGKEEFTSSGAVTHRPTDLRQFCELAATVENKLRGTSGRIGILIGQKTVKAHHVEARFVEPDYFGHGADLPFASSESQTATFSCGTALPAI